MKRYDSYKDSGVKWLGQIPSHWEVKHLRNFLTLFSEKGYGDCQLLSVTREKGVILRDKDNKEENHNFVPDDLSGYKHLNAGDFVINKMKSWQGSYGVSEYEGIVSPAYFTCKLHGVKPSFFSRAIRSKAYIGFFMQYSKGIRVDQWDLDPNSMKDIPFLLPPIAEQDAIVTYLDTATAKIDAAILQQQKMIDLLNERKQIIINNAVTKGLNPNVKMKDSGVELIGEIPSHWEVLALKHILKLKKNIIGNRASQFDLLSLTLRGIVKRDMENPEGKFPASFDTYQIVQPNDFVFCNFDNEETPRSVGLSSYLGMITGAYDVLSRKNPNLTDRYLLYYFLYIDDAKRFKPLYKGLRKTVPFDAFMSYKIPVPPIAEQDAIVTYLDTATAKIDTAILQQQKMIDLLKERKQLIINDVVTGKIKV